MRSLLCLFLLLIPFISFGETIVVNPQPNIYYYDEYQPYNGPMRGPNSIEGHKSWRERAYQNRNLPPMQQ